MSKYVQGDKELIEKLQRLKTKDAKAAIRKGSRAGIKKILPLAKANAPVRTGTLKKNLKVKAIPRSRKYVGTQIKLDYTGPTFYGAFVEYGSKHVQARHFMQKATDDKQAVALDTAISVMKEEIETRMKL
jgi:HK97 gp10 family phage protein